MPESFRIVALISAYNEEDIISAVIGHLVENGIDVYLLDDASTDGTVTEARAWLGRGLVAIETLPGASSSEDRRFEWSAILRRKEVLARELDADWFIHHDADEVRESPWPGVSLRDGIRWVDRLGYNAIDFRVLNFRPIDDGFRRGDDPRRYFTYYEPGDEVDRLQVKCWKNRPEPIALANGGHEARFADRRIFPLPFLLRHYPVRGQAHGRRKVFAERKRRYTEAERAKGWHVQYDAIVDESHMFLGDPDALRIFDGDRVRLDLLLEHAGGPRFDELRAALERASSEQAAAIRALEAESTARQQAMSETAALRAELDTALERASSEHAAAVRALEAESTARQQAASETAALERTLASVAMERDRTTAEIVSLRRDRDGLIRALEEEQQERERLERTLLRLVERSHGSSDNGHSNGASDGESTRPNGADQSAGFVYGPDAQQDAERYRAWLAAQDADASAERLRARLAAASRSPRISVIVPVYRPDLALLERAVASVHAQIHADWQLCLCDDGSGDRAVKAYLDRLGTDPRCRVSAHQENRGIAAALNTALATAEGAFVCFLDQDDELHREAIGEIAAATIEDPAVDLVYTDEDKIDETGVHCEPFFKPDWSPDMLLSHMYVGHLVAARRTLVERIGGFRSGFDGSQDYDLVLRASEVARSIHHVPKVLYHWRKVPGSTAERYAAKPQAHQAARAALRSALVRRGEQAEVLEGLLEGTFRVRRRIRRNTRVSVIVPFRDGVEWLERSVAAVRAADYENREILLVDNESWQPETRAYLRSLSGAEDVRVLSYPRSFNFSALNNWAVRQASGDVLLFLNNDVDGGSPDWLSAMVEHAERPDVGVVGARLLYPNGRVQHAGLAIGMLGVAGHCFRFLPSEAGGYFGHAKVIRNTSGVTGACMMVRRRVFDEVGGFDEALAVAFNDVDFCLRVRKSGYAIIYTPFAELVHHESASRGVANDRGEIEHMRRRWGAELCRDPYFNPNFCRHREAMVLPDLREDLSWSTPRSTSAN
jgi:GT2 family glycosyltransferase